MDNFLTQFKKAHFDLLEFDKDKKVLHNLNVFFDSGLIVTEIENASTPTHRAYLTGLIKQDLLDHLFTLFSTKEIIYPFTIDYIYLNKNFQYLTSDNHFTRKKKKSILEKKKLAMFEVFNNKNNNNNNNNNDLANTISQRYLLHYDYNFDFYPNMNIWLDAILPATKIQELSVFYDVMKHFKNEFENNYKNTKQGGLIINTPYKNNSNSNSNDNHYLQILRKYRHYGTISQSLTNEQFEYFMDQEYYIFHINDHRFGKDFLDEDGLLSYLYLILVLFQCEKILKIK